jgi:hypothetical protein
MYDRDILLILGGAPGWGAICASIFTGGAKRLLYWGTIMVTVEFDAKKPL